MLAEVRPQLVVRTLDDAAAARWDAFVEACPEATFFHRAGWRRVLEEAFGHPTWYLYAERGGEIQGVLPLARIRSRLFADALISTPFCVYGGAAARDETARAALEARAAALAEELGVQYLELRNRAPRRPEWHRRPHYVTFRKVIDPDPEVNLRAVPRKQRAMIRKGIEAGLEAEVVEETDTLHAVYAESVRNLGTPVFHRRYLRLLKETFGEACEVRLVRHRGEVVAGVMSFYFRDEVLPYYGGGRAAARDLKANDFMYWSLMADACRRGVRVFDYGRSKVDSGSYRFKKHWGFTPEPLHYEVLPVRARRIPDVSPRNPRYRLFIAAWRRLPLAVANRLGPWLARDLG
ncbi:FemAB family XrtA/PEP-CTERM system-associated protein [Inmirania thermothiophila]|uniref:FemAB-related protein (PEP-CTERM system-associated) n=1 Tax=Inmirania thermothiophila TaxID=1750597 RepID=A0A3N1Y889_9GAMM|nr:FemAB family XrtA/PEP-CTERM system-associated protein [Inmirania thermothiophila]ROR34741.1 FemAB-related protein (PEP-CTERM system-associated) [Inmirania thermothiophila]